MANNTLLERLEGLDARFEEIQTLITDPSVIADQKRYVKLSKEYKSLENLLKVTHEYKKMVEDINDAKELLTSESDEELRAMAREEIDTNQEELPKLELLPIYKAPFLGVLAICPPNVLSLDNIALFLPDTDPTLCSATFK